MQLLEIEIEQILGFFFLLHRHEPLCYWAPDSGSSCASAVCCSVEGDEAEGCDAVWSAGEVCDVSMWDRSWDAHIQAPGQTDIGAERTGDSLQEKRNFWVTHSS